MLTEFQIRIPLGGKGVKGAFWDDKSGSEGWRRGNRFMETES